MKILDGRAQGRLVLTKARPLVLVPLSRGLYALIDYDDYDLIKRFKWCAQKNYCGSGWSYAVTRSVESGKAEWLRMHRVIAGLRRGDGLEVDHKNQVTLDNRRANLRAASASQNRRNRPRRVDSRSPYKCVSNHRCGWMAYIRYEGKRQHLGYFSTPEAAARAYNKAAIEFYGEFASLNEVPYER